MAEYLAPGVYVEETSFRARSIEGVSTSTTSFVGPTRRGPSGSTPELLTSFGDFQRIYGGLDNLVFGSKSELNYLAHAVRAYFDNGGSRLYVSRAVTSGAALAKLEVKDAGGMTTLFTFNARFAGDAGNGQVIINRTETQLQGGALDKAPLGTLLLQAGADEVPAVAEVKDANGTVTTAAKAKVDAIPAQMYVRTAGGWLAADATDPKDAVASSTLVRRLTMLSVTVTVVDKDGNAKNFGEVGLDPAHPRYIGTVLAAQPTRRVDALENLLSFDVPVMTTIAAPALFTALLTGAVDGQKVFTLSSGTDGTAAPSAAAYTAALDALAALEDISIVAAPGYSANSQSDSIEGALIIHVERRRSYRIAVLDSKPDLLVGGVREQRSRIDSTYAALYYPWVVVANPLARPGDASIPAEITLPPSGFVCGIYARTDVQRGVWKAPANEVVLGALRFEREVNFAEQEVLNPSGINCLRSFPERGSRVWGARTASSDQEWKYVNIRRYFNYLERSIDVGTQFAVFEPNGEKLWTQVRDSITSFLENEWRQGALLGTSPKQAFFVRCDRSTMSQNDLDNGRLICLIGVAAVKPAEFVIFRIGQTTADARS